MKQYQQKLRKVKGKYYVCMTVPVEVREILGRQIRASTGTANEKEALLRYPAIALELQEKITQAKESLASTTLKKDIVRLAEQLNLSSHTQSDMDDEEDVIQTLRNLDKATSGKPKEHVGTYSLSKLKNFLDSETELPKAPNPTTRRKALAEVKKLIKQYDASASTISNLANEYEASRIWQREKSRNAFHSHVNKFRLYFGDVEIEEVKPFLLYSFAEELTTKDNHSNATVKNYMSSISNVLAYAVRKGHIEFNPAKNLDLGTYGKPKLVRRAFSDTQLHDLFQLNLTPQIRILWSILISTGMRLDEAALLERSNLEVERNIWHFNLTEAVVKNTGSARKVPVPDAIAGNLNEFMRGINTERLFSFPVNADGKAQNSASKASMRFIRRVTKDRAYVTHSFRHKFKDLCRDAEIAKDLHDFITGHSGGDSASHYGEGHSLKVRQTALNKIKHPWLG